MIPESEIASIRNDATRLLLDTCLIKTETVVSDGQGGFTSTWTETDNVPCRLAPASGEGDGAGDRLDERTTHVLTLPFDVTVTTQSRIVIAGEPWTVTALTERRFDRFVYRAEVMLDESYG